MATTVEQIKGVLTTDRWMTRAEVEEALPHRPANSVRGALSRMAKDGTVDFVKDGRGRTAPMRFRLRG